MTSDRPRGFEPRSSAEDNTLAGTSVFYHITPMGGHSASRDLTYIGSLYIPGFHHLFTTATHSPRDTRYVNGSQKLMCRVEVLQP
ncbi:hypothetical protein TNCV_2556881 [Trichonephila clavipes]|nr:hypothetical protein TNCV_2556881 [Trichonephila clavipes]